MKKNPTTKKTITYILALCLAISLIGPVPIYTARAKTKVKLNKTKVTLQVGKTVQLKLKGTGKKVTWTSSNKKVAVVTKKGRVTAKKAGKATITARAGKKKYKCRLTVKAKKKTEGTGQPSDETKNYDAGEYSITKVHSGEGTYYDRVSAGAANLDYLEENYYTVAMNNEDYMNGLAGAYIQITDKDGDTIKAFVTDRLPEGKKGDVDLSRKAFEKLEPLVTGRMNITWRIIPVPTKEPVSYVFKPTSTPYWAEVQVRNGRYPIKKLEYLDKSTGKYVELERQEYNYFTAPSGMGAGPYTFRVTDFYGHVLVDKNISINTSETPVKGSKNFPY